MDAKDTLRLLETHPLTQELKAKEAARILETRQAAAVKLEALTAEAECIPGMVAAVDAVEADLKAHDKARQTIVDRWTAARMALMEARERMDRQRSQAEAVLIETADPAIDEGIRHFRSLHEELLHTEANEQTRTGARNLITERQDINVYSNHPAIVAGLEYARAAVRALEGMKLAVSPNVERIAELKRNIPDVHALTELAGTKPLPDNSRRPAPASYTDRLLEQAKKLLSR
jgi:hypothetical protein